MFGVLVSHLFSVHWCFRAILTIVKPKARVSESKARVQVQSPISFDSQIWLQLFCVVHFLLTHLNNCSWHCLGETHQWLPSAHKTCQKSGWAPKSSMSACPFKNIPVGDWTARKTWRLGKHSWAMLSPKKPLINTLLFLSSSCTSEIKCHFGQHFSALSCPVQTKSFFFTFLSHWKFNTTPCKACKTSSFKTQPWMQLPGPWASPLPG